MDYAKMNARWGMEPPSLFSSMERAGLIANDPPGVRFSRFFWLSAHQIADEQWLLPHIPQLVPFARSAGRDHFAWHLNGTPDPWVAECPRDSNMALGYAPSFKGFLYRAMLEELADCWLGDILNLDIRETHQLLISYANRVRPYVAESWGATLIHAANQEIKRLKSGGVATISTREIEDIINADLPFPMLHKEFAQHLD